MPTIVPRVIRSATRRAGVDDRARRDAGEDALLVGEPAGHDDRVAVRDQQLPVERGPGRGSAARSRRRGCAGRSPGRPGAARTRRSWISGGAPSAAATTPISVPPVPRPGDEDVDLRAVAHDLLGRALVVGARVGRVAVLEGHVEPVLGRRAAARPRPRRSSRTRRRWRRSRRRRASSSWRRSAVTFSGITATSL